MNIDTVFYIIIFSFIILSLFRNFFSYVILRNKVYLSFFYFLFNLALIVFFKRIYPAIDSMYNVKIDLIVGMINFVFISGSTLLFSKYFLHIPTVNTVTISYFVIEVITVGALTITGFFMNRLVLFSQIIHSMVFIYALGVFIYIIVNYLQTKERLAFKHSLKYIVFLFMQADILVITAYYSIGLLPPLISLAFLLSVVVYLEVELMIKALGNNTVVSESKLDDVDHRIINMIKEGKVYKEISYDLKMPINTLKKRIGSIFRYYGVSSRTALIAVFLNGKVKSE